MTWEETIKYIRTLPEFSDLIEKAYLDERLHLNVERFVNGEEWQETLAILKKYAPNAETILDVGSGNGISAIGFALAGYNVTVIEPDPSETVGAGAISKLKAYYHLPNIDILQVYAENAELKNKMFDVVYSRQAMHHANDLCEYIKNISSQLKKKGLFLTVRDHVIFNKEDKKRFLNAHPLQKFYGGENAFKPSEYRYAIKKADLKLIDELKYYESIINYFPRNKSDVQEMQGKRKVFIRNASQKVPLASSPVFYWLFQILFNIRYGKVYNEQIVPGRMYSYLALKK